MYISSLYAGECVNAVDTLKMAVSLIKQSITGSQVHICKCMALIRTVIYLLLNLLMTLLHWLYILQWFLCTMNEYQVAK